ncbi:MAG: hypothetical protein ACK6DX_23100, partial [Acidobacteriota bacterium]
MNPSLPLSRKPVSGGRPGGGAAAAGPPSVFNWQALRRAEIGVPVAVLGIIMAMILPLPPLLL